METLGVLHTKMKSGRSQKWSSWLVSPSPFCRCNMISPHINGHANEMWFVRHDVNLGDPTVCESDLMDEVILIYMEEIGGVYHIQSPTSLSCEGLIFALGWQADWTRTHRQRTHRHSPYFAATNLGNRLDFISNHAGKLGQECVLAQVSTKQKGEAISNAGFRTLPAERKHHYRASGKLPPVFICFYKGRVKPSRWQFLEPSVAGQSQEPCCSHLSPP